MTDLSQLLQQSSAHAWLFVPSAILLGALHGLEPGHSKTMMAAFIVAIRGTVLQAVLLGLSATISHTAIVWVIALAGLHFGQELSGERSEAYLQMASAVIIIGIAGWMVWRTWREQNEEHTIITITTSRNPSCWPGSRCRSKSSRAALLRAGGSGARPAPSRPRSDIRVATFREDGAGQAFAFVARDGYLESIEEIPEPHAFKARVALAGGTAEVPVRGTRSRPHGSRRRGRRARACPCGRHPQALRRTHGYDDADRSVRPDRRPDPLPGGDHRAATLHPVEAVCPRLRPGAVLRHRSRDHHGLGRRSGGAQLAARRTRTGADSAVSRTERPTFRPR